MLILAVRNYFTRHEGNVLGAEKEYYFVNWGFNCHAEISFNCIRLHVKLPRCEIILCQYLIRNLF